MDTLIKIILSDGYITEGFIARETETHMWLEEYRTMGDRLILNKANIVSMSNV